MGGARSEGVGVRVDHVGRVVVREEVEELTAIARAIASGQGDVSVDSTQGAAVGAVVETT